MSPLYKFVTTEVAKGKKPRAVVLVYGFSGSKPKHVAKYTAVYNAYNCSTVGGTSLDYDVFTANLNGQDAFGLESVRQVTKVLRSDNLKGHNDVPVVMHIISNGGAFISARLGRMLDAAAKEDKQDDRDNQDLRLFGQRLMMGYQVFDSAPAYANAKSAFNVMRGLIQTPIINTAMAAVFTVGVVLLESVATLTGRTSTTEAFWTACLQDSSCMRQAFVYSHDDDIADATKIEELIEERKKLGVHIMTKSIENSKHVQHLRLYEEDYKEFVAAVLKDMEDENKK